MKLTKQHVSEIMYDGGCYDDNSNLLYEVVDEKMVDNDIEKNSVTTRYVIHEVSTGKFYAARLTESPWWKQAEANAETEWREVQAKTKTITYYE